MKLPPKCPHRRSGKNWRPSFLADDESQVPPCCRMMDHSVWAVFLPKRGPLCAGIEHTIEEYRFTWRSSFHGNVVGEITANSSISEHGTPLAPGRPRDEPAAVGEV
jgi:hypothetical protein